MPFRPKEMISVKEVASLQYLALYAAEYADGDVKRPWDLVRRVHSRSSQHDHNAPRDEAGTTLSSSSSPIVHVDLPIDAIDLVAILEHKNSSREMVVVVQYRPPLDAFCLEFPAGLIDAGETAIEAALRELREETGYAATVEDCDPLPEPVLAYEPGMTNSCFKLVTVHVDMTLPENQHPVQHLDGGEDIAVYTIPYDGSMLNALGDIRLKTEREQEGKRCVIDGKLFCYAEGLRAAFAATAPRRSGLEK